MLSPTDVRTRACVGVCACVLSVLWKGVGVLRVHCQLFLELEKNPTRFLPHGMQQCINTYKTPQENKKELSEDEEIVDRSEEHLGVSAALCD